MNELTMAVYQEAMEPVRSADYSKLEKKLNEAVNKGEIQQSEITENPGKAKSAMQYLHNLIDEFYRNPEKYSYLKRFLNEKKYFQKGYHAKDCVYKGVFDDMPSAVARTNTENSVEANINLAQMIEQMSQDAGCSKDAIEELVMTHEMIHLSQPDYIKKGQPAPYVAEIDAELVLTEYFAKKAQGTKGAKQERYSLLSNLAYARAEAIYRAYSNSKN